MLCSFWLSTIFLFMVIVAKSVIQIVDSVGVFLSALGLHNYNRLLALHLQKKVLALLHSFSSQNAPKIQSDLFYKIFWGGMPPDPPSISMLRMLIVVLCTINLTSNFTLYKGPPLIFYAPGPLISLGASARVYVCMYTPEAINNLWLDFGFI